MEIGVDCFLGCNPNKVFERCDYPNTLLAKNKHQLGVLQKQKAQSTDFCSEYCALTVVLWCDYLNLFLFKT